MSIASKILRAHATIQKRCIGATTWTMDGTQYNGVLSDLDNDVGDSEAGWDNDYYGELVFAQNDVSTPYTALTKKVFTVGSDSYQFVRASSDGLIVTARVKKI
jgi:hypothetical protein